MATRPPLRTLALAGALALTLTACGGEDRLTKAEFIKQADAICTGDDDAIKKVADGLTEDSSDEEIDEAIAGYVAIVKKQVEKLDDLQPPESLEKDVDAMLKSLGEGLDEMEEKGHELIGSDENPLGDASEKAKAIGLEKCGA